MRYMVPSAALTPFLPLSGPIEDKVSVQPQSIASCRGRDWPKALTTNLPETRAAIYSKTAALCEQLLNGWGLKLKT